MTTWAPLVDVDAEQSSLVMQRCSFEPACYISIIDGLQLAPSRTLTGVLMRPPNAVQVTAWIPLLHVDATP